MNKIFFLALLVFISCGSSSYIEKVPTKYDYTKAINKKISLIDSLKSSKYENYDDNPEKLDDKTLKIKEKYAILLMANPKEIKNYKLYGYIDEWLGTPYKKNSLDKSGADCAYFIQTLFSEVYGETLPKNATGMANHPSIEKFSGRAYLQEGDLVFFRYSKDSPYSDVGLYLRNDRILACGLKDGLNIYNFNDDYFQTRFVAAGRQKEKK